MVLGPRAAASQVAGRVAAAVQERHTEEEVKLALEQPASPGKVMLERELLCRRPGGGQHPLVGVDRRKQGPQMLQRAHGHLQKRAVGRHVGNRATEANVLRGMVGNGGSGRGGGGGAGAPESSSKAAAPAPATAAMAPESPVCKT